MNKENWHKYLISYQDACNQSIRNIEDLRDGKIKFINSGFDILNNVFFNGLQTNRITIIAALSSVGKTTYVSQLRKNILQLNDNIEWLSFNFEMIASDIIDNEIVAELNVDLRTLYSVDNKIDNTLPDNINTNVVKKNKPINFVDIPLDYKMIGEIVYEYWREVCKKDNKILIYDIDHALIVNGLETDSETKKVENLMKILNQVKKSNVQKYNALKSQQRQWLKNTEKSCENSQVHYTYCMYGEYNENLTKLKKQLKT